jgi:L-cystine uptake protein TcyP (sodium:dicarboxylate symporter family)
LWKFPSAAPAFTIGFLVFGLAISISSVFEKHKSVSPQAEARRRILKDVLFLVITIILALTLGGIAALLASRYAQGFAQAHWPGFELLAGFVSAIVAAFTVGFVVRWSVQRAVRS